MILQFTIMADFEENFYFQFELMWDFHNYMTCSAIPSWYIQR